MTDVFLCDGIRTPVGRYGGGLAPVRTDDLAAIPIAALMERNAGVDWAAVDDVMLGCANQAGEDNRNVARMSSLLAGLPQEIPASTINRLCGSGLNAVGSCANAIRSVRRRRPDDRRWRGEHVTFTIRDRQGRKCVRPNSENVRHHHGLALREQETRCAVRHRNDAADRGAELRKCTTPPWAGAS
jgi:hypothetical protein